MILSYFLVQMNLIKINIFIFNFKLILYYEFILFFSSNEPNLNQYIHFQLQTHS